ncbi:MAG TPA: hypothetical protein VE083_08070 [Terriglobales bacterium]|nr:hypothetical protein [Terriglobales bacterium]
MDQWLDLADSQNNLVSQLAVLAVSMDDEIRSLVGDLRIPSGVVVWGRAADVFGPDIGLTTGDVIQAVNGSSGRFRRASAQRVSQLKPGDSVALQVERRGKLPFVSFEMDSGVGEWCSA